MKRKDLIRRITKQAKASGVNFTVAREGGKHTVYDLGGKSIPIPRHKEIGEGLTRAIFEQTEAALPPDWWR